jgi:hypothetical protein
MKVQFVKGHKQGAIEEKNDAYAKALIKIGLAKEYKKKEEKAAFETKEEKTETETKKAGRPKRK